MERGQVDNERHSSSSDSDNTWRFSVVALDISSVAVDIFYETCDHRLDPVPGDTSSTSSTSAATGRRRVHLSERRDCEQYCAKWRDHRTLNTDHWPRTLRRQQKNCRRSMILTSDHAELYILSMAFYRFRYRALACVSLVVFHRLFNIVHDN